LLGWSGLFMDAVYIKAFAGMYVLFMAAVYIKAFAGMKWAVYGCMLAVLATQNTGSFPVFSVSFGLFKTCVMCDVKEHY